jgi:hypothetical protein
VFLLGARVIRTQQFLQFSLAHLPPHDASALFDSPIILRVPFCVAHLFFFFLVPLDGAAVSSIGALDMLLLRRRRFAAV